MEKKLSDKEILELSYKSPREFAVLFDRHSTRLLAIARKAVRSKDEAEDIVQETFVRIYKHGRKFLENKNSKKGDFVHWVNAILRNCIIDAIRKRKTGEITLTEELENVIPAGDNYALAESDNYIQSVFKKLDLAAAEVLNLRFVLGKSFKEIGRLLNITSTAARVRVYRAKKNFIEVHTKLNIN